MLFVQTAYAYTPADNDEGFRGHTLQRYVPGEPSPFHPTSTPCLPSSGNAPDHSFSFPLPPGSGQVVYYG